MVPSFRQWTFLLVALCAVWLGSCSTATPTADAPAETPQAANETPQLTVANAANPTAGLPVLEGMAKVELTVNGSPIVITVDGDDAPVTAGNFVDLVNRGVYDGLMFHRVVKEPQPFVVQGGDPQSRDPNFPAQQLGTGSFVDPDTGETRYIPLEIKPSSAAQPLYSETFETAGITEKPALTHNRGAVAMARSQLVDSASSQFYIALADLPFLDGDYAVFGTVTEGMDVVDAIQQGDRIESARVVEGLDNLKTNAKAK